MNLRKSVQEFSLECKSFKCSRGKGTGEDLTQTTWPQQRETTLREIR